MTVQELIDELSKYPPEYRINTEDTEEQYSTDLRVFKCPFEEELVIISAAEPDSDTFPLETL